MDERAATGLGDARRTLQRADAARMAGRRMIARGERPGYRVEIVRLTPDVGIRIVELPWLQASVASRRDIVATARTLVAGWLGVSPDAFDVEAA